jgi:hypothetical protein
MREKIEVGFQTFVSDGQEELGAVREISADGRRLTVYVESRHRPRSRSRAVLSAAPCAPR